MARNEQLIRQHRLLQVLERYRFGRLLEELRDDLVDELGLTSLHVRSVRRDLEALQAAGIDVAAHDSPRGRVWKLGPGFRGAHKITASATELIALSLGRDLLLPLAGTPFWVGVESFWSKMHEALPPAVWSHYERYRQSLFVRGMAAKSYAGRQGMLSTLHRAIQEHRVVEIEYQSIGAAEPRVREIEPLAVVYYQSSLYIVAGDAESPADTPAGDRVRHFKLDRFHKATALDRWFKPPAGFDIEAHLRNSLGIFSGTRAQNYRIRISPRAAPWVQEDPWRPDQQLEPQPDGSWILTVAAAHDLEIIQRVLAMGGEAEVLSPARCRRELHAQAARLAEQHAPREK